MTGTAPPPGPHGGDGARLARSLGVNPTAVLDLSVSLNPVAPDITGLVAGVAAAARTYPEPDEATAALSDCLGVESERVLLTNGGAEAIALVAAARPVGRVDEPEFSLYRRHLAEVVADGPRWRSNPNNPTGRLAGIHEAAAVWDEAFYPLATGSWTRGDAGAIIVGSLTKLFACPGIRLGYVIAPDGDLVAELRRRQAQWSVGSLALALVPQLLATADLAGWCRAVGTLRGDLVTVLEEHGHCADPSDVNYVLVRHAPGLRDRLARAAVLVRDTTSFGWPDGVRVAVPDPAGLERLAAALAATGGGEG